MKRKLREKIELGFIDEKLLEDIDLSDGMGHSCEKWDIDGFWGSGDTPQPENEQKLEINSAKEEFEEDNNLMDMDGENVAEVKSERNREEEK